MNLYIIVEGRRTEKKVYPVWLSYLIPDLHPVDWAYQASKDNYYLFNVNGFPALLHNHLKNSIEEVNEIGVFNYLVLLLDVDESTIRDRIKEVDIFVEENNLNIKSNTKLIVIPQNRCFETWFLGNKNMIKYNPQDSLLLEFIKYYDVSKHDPEAMGIHPNFNTHSQFHSDYCIKFLRERNIRYSKNRPNGVTEEYYLNKLIERSRFTHHLKSFQTFIDFCSKVKSEMLVNKK